MANPEHEDRIAVHHIGGRSGGHPLQRQALTGWADDIVHVLYDADASCLELLRERTADQKSLRVVSACIGGVSGKADFHINYDPFTSSLRKVRPGLRDWYLASKGYDYLFPEAAEAGEIQSLDAVSLDDLFGSPGPGFPPPNVLSMDVQGAELDILKGAPKVIGGNVVAIELEARFSEIYDGEGLFPDILGFLSSLGFDFVGFTQTVPFSPYRAGVGLRGEGYLLEADALFYRNPDRLLEDENPNRNALLAKLAFIAMTSHHMEVAVRCLDLIDRGYLENNRQTKRYLAFLDDCGKAVSAMPGVMPLRFAEFYSFEESRARFLPTAERAAFYKENKAAMEARLGSYMENGRISVENVKTLGRAEETPIETVLREYGFTDLAGLLRERRISQVKSIAETLGG